MAQVPDPKGNGGDYGGSHSPGLRLYPGCAVVKSSHLKWGGKTRKGSKANSMTFFLSGARRGLRQGNIRQSQGHGSLGGQSSGQQAPPSLIAQEYPPKSCNTRLGGCDPWG